MAKRNQDTGQNKVLALMQKHPGVVYSSQSLRDEMGIAEDADGNVYRALGASMLNLSRKGLIEKVAMGKFLYRKVPEQQTKKVAVTITGNLYEAIGTRKSTGNVIVKDDANNLYELHEL